MMNEIQLGFAALAIIFFLWMLICIDEMRTVNRLEMEAAIAAENEYLIAAPDDVRSEYLRAEANLFFAYSNVNGSDENYRHWLQQCIEHKTIDLQKAE